MQSVPPDLHDRLKEHDQEHVLAHWDRLSIEERHEIVNQLVGLDLAMLRRLHGEQGKTAALPPPDRIEPLPVIRADADPMPALGRGEDALRRGEVAVVMVAGGQGSRLGFEKPKGMYPVGPVSRKTLFQVHAEKLRALGRRYGRPLPFCVMTSDATHDETVADFEGHGYFGLSAQDVAFFRQGTMPALDLATGRLLLEAPGRLFLGPNGHGGTLTALADSGLLAKLRGQGIRHVYYFQVDNPLAKIADPVFVGRHAGASAQVSSKVVAKSGPEEKMGVLVRVDGRCMILEYSDLPAELTRQRDEKGELRLWAGNPAIHLFDLDFLAQLTQGETRLPFHLARKKVPHLDESGQVVQPDRENALKFEMFIFDALPMADRWTVVETSRAEEFAPLKNATGADSPATVEQAMSDLTADWLEKAGAKVLRRADGTAAVAPEVSPLFALDAAELARRVPPGLVIDGPKYFE